MAKEKFIEMVNNRLSSNSYYDTITTRRRKPKFKALGGK